MATFSICRSCILVVDDDLSVLRILSKILRKAGLDVTAVDTGELALKNLRSHTYDLAIIDVRLQDMNGLDLLDKINKITPEMRKIILTGYPSDEDRGRALELGAFLYLSKPIKPEKLIEIVKQTIN